VELLQLRVLGFGLLQDGDVGVGVFPVKSQTRVWTIREGTRPRRRGWLGADQLLFCKTGESAAKAVPSLVLNEPFFQCGSRPRAQYSDDVDRFAGAVRDLVWETTLCTVWADVQD